MGQNAVPYARGVRHANKSRTLTVEITFSSEIKPIIKEIRNLHVINQKSNHTDGNPRNHPFKY